MWDPTTTRVVVMQDIIRLKHMHFQPVDTEGVLELDDVLHATDDVDGITVDDMVSVKTVVPSKLEGNVTRNNPIVTGYTTS